MEERSKQATPMHSLANSHRIVIKIGSALLVDPETQHIHHAWLESLITDIQTLTTEGKQIIIVSSGAIAIGKLQLGLTSSHISLNKKQAASAVGQIELTRLYAHLCQQAGLTAAQVLLTISDTEHRRRYINLTNTLNTLIDMHTIPIINENDSVGTAEIRYGDNDRLAARVAQMVNADTLLLLSDIDGLYNDNPHTNPNADFIDVVTDITDTHYRYAKASHSGYGSGGMRTKLDAARIATHSGTHMLILSGKPEHPISHYIQTSRGTWFTAKQSPQKAKKIWLSEHLQQQGHVIIDDGAAHALLNGASLLPVGVTAVNGTFDKGDIIGIRDRNGHQLTCGLTNYNSKDTQALCGKHSSDIESHLGYRGYDEVIHRDNLGFLRPPEGTDHDLNHT